MNCAPGGHPRRHWQALDSKARLHGAVGIIVGDQLGLALQIAWGHTEKRNSLLDAMSACLVGTLVFIGRLWTAKPGCMVQLTPSRATC